MSETFPQVESLYPTDADRRAALAVDRYIETMPLPGHELSHHSSEEQRQTALAVSEITGIARSAGELGLTSAEWRAKRDQLGRYPTLSDL
ncbi:MAG: hypothetical protein ACREF7_02975 [Candidatus Saccharimonadales bacterium]